MNTEKFVKKVNKQIKKIKEDFGYSQDGDAFVHWCIKIKYDFDEDDISQYAAIGGKGDKSIDAFWSDEDTRTVFIVQGKYSRRGESQIDRKEIATFGESIGWLAEIKDEDSTQNERLYEASIEFKEKEEKDFGIKLTFFAFGTFAPEAVKEKDKFNKKYMHTNIEMELINITQIGTIYNTFITAVEPKPERIALPLKENEYFIKEAPVASIIATVKAKDIAQIRKDYGTNIHRSNVRYFIGKNRINEGISNTVKDSDQNKKFWYFNNGLSIVCDSFKVEDHKLILEGMQIVNGCQTTEVLKNNMGHLNDEVEILVRVIELQDPSLSSKITEYTNTQNPTTPRDLMSNEDIQEKLHKEFRRYKPPYFYERKRGEFKAFLDTLSSKNKKENKIRFRDTKISNEKLAQAYWAFIGSPASAKSEKGMLFISKEQKGYYEDIFSKKRTVEELLLPYRMFKYIVELRKAAILELKREKEELEKISDEEKRTKKTEEIALGDFIKYADFTILAGIGNLCEKVWSDFKLVPYEEILDKFDEIMEKVYKKIYIELKYLVKDEFELGSSHNSFFKDKKTFEKLKNKIDYQCERSESEGKSYFEGIPYFE